MTNSIMEGLDHGPADALGGSTTTLPLQVHLGVDNIQGTPFLEVTTAPVFALDWSNPSPGSFGSGLTVTMTTGTGVNLTRDSPSSPSVEGSFTFTPNAIIGGLDEYRQSRTNPLASSPESDRTFIRDVSNLSLHQSSPSRSSFEESTSTSSFPVSSPVPPPFIQHISGDSQLGTVDISQFSNPITSDNSLYLPSSEGYPWLLQRYHIPSTRILDGPFLNEYEPSNATNMRSEDVHAINVVSPSTNSTSSVQYTFRTRRQGNMTNLPLNNSNSFLETQPVVVRPNVTTPATANASRNRRRSEARFVCTVQGCHSTFTRRYNLLGKISINEM